MKKTNWNEYQQAIFNEVEKGNGSIVVNAVAGSGKTTTIVECARRAKKRDTLFLAFNNSIVNELSKKLGASATCSTLHKCGLTAIGATYGKYNIDNKNWYWRGVFNAYIQNILGEVEYSVIAPILNNAFTLFNLCRVELLQATDIEKIKAIALHHNIDTNEIILQAVVYGLSSAYTPRFVGQTIQIDFTDMLVFPSMIEAVKRNVSKHSLVFIDECQDLSTAQRNLMLLSVAENGRFIAVGDPRQAINGFCGADCNSFAKLAEIADKELPLSCNYRCGYDIIKLAQEIVPNIVAHENAESGNVHNVNDLTDIKEGDMVLCRKSAPLVRVALKCMANNIRAKVLGKDILEGIAKLVKDTKVRRIDTLLEKLDNQVDKARQKHETNAKEMSANKLQVLEDKVQAVYALTEDINPISNNGTTELLNKLENLFKDRENAITFATCHKSKGLENERVFILLPNKLPLTWKGQLDWQLEQEKNLKYVAITRAKKDLFWVDVEEDKLKDIKVR